MYWSSVGVHELASNIPTAFRVRDSWGRLIHTVASATKWRALYILEVLFPVVLRRPANLEGGPAEPFLASPLHAAIAIRRPLLRLAACSYSRRRPNPVT